MNSLSTLYREKRNNLLFVVVFSFSLIVLNLALKNVNALLGMPFFFDTIGTALAASLFGLLPGIVVGFATNGVQEVLAGFTWQNLPWAVCSVASAIIVWFRIYRQRFVTPTHLVVTILLVAIVNSVLGAVIATVVYGGMTGVPIDYIVIAMVTSGRGILFSAFLARIPSNLIDKGIAVVLAFSVYRAVVVSKYDEATYLQDRTASDPRS